MSRRLLPILGALLLPAATVLATRPCCGRATILTAVEALAGDGRLNDEPFFLTKASAR